MGLYDGMGFWERVIVTVALPVLAPAAVVAAAYEIATNKGSTSNNQNEQEERERAERQAKEKRAEEARQAIISYAKNGLIVLQKMHSSAEQKIPTSLSFTQLREAIKSNKQPIEILTHLLPNAPGSDTASVAQQKTYLLNDEIRDLKKLRQAIIDVKTFEVNA